MVKLKKNQTKPPLKKGIIHDPISAKDMRELNVIHACEHCTHFDGENIKCSFGHIVTPHLLDNQMKIYRMSGQMPLCRNLEID